MPRTRSGEVTVAFMLVPWKRVLSHIIPGRGIPLRGVAPPSHMPNMLGRRAFHPTAQSPRGGDPGLRSGRRAPGLMQRITPPGD